MKLLREKYCILLASIQRWGNKGETMKKINIIFIGMLIMMIPAVFAENRDIDDIPIDIKWSISKDGNGSIYNITINVSSEDKDHTFNRILTNTSSNGSDTIKIDIERDIVCKEEDISNLTRTLIQSSLGFVNTINNSFNFPKEYSDCIEGRARIAENNKVYLLERDKFKNDSDMYKGLYDSETESKDGIKDSLDTCNTNLLNTNTDYNTCSSDLEKTKKKPMQYALVSILFTVIAINLYNKNKEPKPPEMFQFKEN